MQRSWFAAGLAAGALALAVGGSAARADVSPPPPAYGSGTLSTQNILDLISQMTVPEEVAMVHGEGDPPPGDSTRNNGCDPKTQFNCVGEAGWIPGVARLGIPPLRLTDGPAGIRLAHVETAMPAPVGLAASFSRDDARLYGKTVGDAGRATDQDVWLAPMINQVNDVTGGRNFETLGEDPFLEGQLVAPEVQGVQGEGMIAMIKHYIENDFESNRTSTSVTIDEQTLHETELQAFESGINAGAGAVMCSYNRVNDVYGCANSHTLQDILKGQLGFTGFVTSDWGAVHHMSDLLHGLDMEQPGGTTGNYNFKTLADAVANGTPAVPATGDFPAEPAHTGAEWKAALDGSVFRILWEMNKIDLLEGTVAGTHHTDGTPFVPPRPDLDSLKPQSFAAAQSIAADSATLVKNDGAALPLSGADLAGTGTVVMGPTAVAPYVGGGGSAHVTPYDPVQSPFDALTQKAASGANLSYVPGYDLDGQVVPSSALTAPAAGDSYPNWTLNPGDAAFAGQSGLLRQQTTIDPVSSGNQPVAAGSGAAPDQLDPTVSYTGANTLPANTGWRWSGYLTAPSNPGGTGWVLKVFAANQAGASLFVDGLTTAQRRVNLNAFPDELTSSYAGLTQTQKSHDPAAEGLQQAASSAITIAPGQQVHLDLRLITGAAPAQIQLRWVPPDDQAASIAAAASAAAHANKAVIFAYDEGTEGQDRGTVAGVSDQQRGLVLPGYQDALISAVVAAQPNTVVVLNTGDPVLMPWASQVKSILEMWYPGQMGGPATADVLLGNANPGGHLPVTFPADNTHFPTFAPNCVPATLVGCDLYPGVVQSPHTYRTITDMDATAGNGIFQGYRWYDKNGVTPLFEFGHGLSYTTFKYSGLSVAPRGDGSVDVGFDVTNTGSRAGSDVAQVYVGPGPAIAGVQQAVRSLRGFDRVQLAPGATTHEVINLAPRSFQYWSAAQSQWVTNPGTRTIYVGDGDSALQAGSTTPVSTTVGGTVPATLSLTIGAPASFGPFTPGVGKTYETSTGATVTSTAGDAVLSVVDPDTAHPGHLVNGSFFLAQPLQAKATKSDARATAYNAVSGSPLNLVSWSAPVSSDPVTLWFQQTIGSNEGLRTGNYGKTLTFTLSTTNP